jgi:hypothetical protein
MITIRRLRNGSNALFRRRRDALERVVDRYYFPEHDRFYHSHDEIPTQTARQMEVSGRMDHSWFVIFHRHRDHYHCHGTFVRNVLAPFARPA